MRVAVTAILAGALILAAPCGVALAGPSSEREAQAEDLFQRGKERMAAHDLAKACALFDESYRLDLAGGTLQNLAICYEDLGKFASAYARFEELRAISKTTTPPRPDRIALADEHIAKLRRRVSRLFVVLPEASLAPRMTVKIDGTTYTGVSLSEGVIVDPGEHRVDVSAPDRITFSTRFEVGGRDRAVRAEVTVPPLAPIPGDHTSPLEPQPHPTRPAGLVLGTVGLAALGAGAVFGVLALSANASGKDKCERGSNPSAPTADFDPVTGHCITGSGALSDANGDKARANDFANIANIALPVGVVALAVGTYLFFRTSPNTPPRAQVVPGPGAARLQVRF
ncbi:MAG: hypothetical protein JWP87_116 [Labilithrix sp.]|nr:hypothetical protein [Labilithrix sp.]